jgi:hypothetical protein
VGAVPAGTFPWNSGCAVGMADTMMNDLPYPGIGIVGLIGACVRA